MSMPIFEVFQRTDWERLRAQKEHLVALSMGLAQPDQALLDGVIGFLDHVQDAAERMGFLGISGRHRACDSRGLPTIQGLAMKQTLMTRKDEGVGEGQFDSIAWLFSEHIKEPDTGEFHAAVFYGHNEDAPERIDLYRTAEPLVTTPVDRVWNAK